MFQNCNMYSNVIIRLGDFHIIKALFTVLGKKIDGSGSNHVLIQSKVCAGGSMTKVLNGKHYNRALRCHFLMSECLERILIDEFF